MKISLSNYAKNFPKPILQQAQKIVIRDVDEVKPRNFVAYADDKSDSFDVLISLDTKKNILDSNCDCEQGGGWCAHKIAFVEFLAQKQSPVKKRVTRTKKVNPTEQILNQIEPEILKKWVLTILEKNTDIAFLFKNEFNPQQVDFTEEQVEALITESIKSIIGKRRSIQTNELAKLTVALTVSLQPVLDFLESDFQKPERMKLLFKINKILLDFNENMYVTSVKIIRFLEKINDNFFNRINNIQDFETWKKQFGFFFDTVWHPKYGVSQIMFQVTKDMYVATENSSLKREFLILKIIKFIDTTKNQRLSYTAGFWEFILEIYVAHNLLEKYPNHLKPNFYENDYNLKLVQSLIDVQAYERAAEVCHICIKDNVNQGYDIPYLDFLKEIYTTTNQINSLVNVVKIYIRIKFSIDSFKFLKEHLSEDEFIRMRKLIYSSLKSKSYYSDKQHAIDYFALIAFEGDYNKMLKEINPGIWYQFFYPYREELYKTNKSLLWSKLVNLEDSFYYIHPEQIEYRVLFAKWVLERYDPVFLSREKSNSYKLRQSLFLAEVFKS